MNYINIAYNIDEGDDDYVKRRLDDWLKRLNDLFSEISSWCKENGWRVEAGSYIPYYNTELMQQKNIAKINQPSLKILDPTGKEILINPKGLWVIGANGRVDIYTHKKYTYLLMRRKILSHQRGFCIA